MPPLVTIERPEEIPLSFAQQRLWFLDQLQPDSTSYLSPRALHLQGVVNIKALERSLQELVHRHESLRTTFAVRVGQPVQIIHPAGRRRLPLIDLQGLRQEDRETVAQWLVGQEGQRPCNLEKGPLLRIYLLRLAAQEHVLLQTLHHIITDGWSNEVLVRELSTLYQAFLIGQSSPLAPLPIQYADYALWQRGWLQGEVLEVQLAYWKKQLAHVMPLALPTDYPRLPVQTYRGAVQLQLLPGALYEDLVILSQQENVTLFMLLLAAFQVLLLRYTGQTDICVGTPIANRTRAEIEEVIGFFVNTLVLRTNLSGNPTFLEELRQVREVCLEAYAHQDIPFEKLVEILQPERDLSRSPLFQVSFQLAHEIAPSQLLPGLNLEPQENGGASADNDLRIMMTKTQQSFSCTAFYNSNLFEAQTINRFLGHFQTLLQGIVLTPETPVALLPLLSEQERHMLLVEWNETQKDYLQDLCIHQLFEQQVECTPDVVVLVFEDEALTYSELNRRANQLAHHLQGLGIGPEGLVGICMERSMEMVIGLLGVLKAGGAYVPLDPNYPAERLAFMVRNTRISVLLKLHDRQDTLSLTSITMVNLKQIWRVLEQLPGQVPESRVQAENMAYVIYTSGSTGIPKGIACTHYNVLNNLTEFQRRWALPDDLHWSLWTNISFDVSVYEIFLPLLSRGTLYLIPEVIRADALACFMWLKQYQVQGGYLPPFLLGPLQHWLCQQATIPALALRYLLVGVEPIPEGQLLALMRSLPALHILNGYGPTETTICATLYPVGELIDTPRTAPIGQPMQNVEV
ncbi:MAG TPA: condensation domain-containing protein, partial [Ktedonobacteraceae bacterium]|nr:condensation domain-containing protein [Ktedonobacteraceae bacterium]